MRVQLQTAIDFIREGDRLIVTKLDRLARSLSDLMKIIQELEDKKVGLRILNLGMDTSTPTGKLMLELEREIMLESQREGIFKAKSEGKYKGRKSIDKDRKQEVIRLLTSWLPKAEVARQLGMGEATVYRIIKSCK